MAIDSDLSDLPGIIQRLDYLEWLGVGVVWLTPFFPSPMADFGYDVSDHQDVDPTFGKLADLERLINLLHERNIRIVIDFVAAHTSDQHPWFIESRSSKSNPKRNWYIWIEAAADGQPPNNWIGRFDGIVVQINITFIPFSKNSLTSTGVIQAVKLPCSMCSTFG